MTDWKHVDNDMTDMRTAVYNLQRNLKIGADKHFRCEHYGKCEESIFKQSDRGDVSKGDWTYVGHQYGRGHGQRKMREDPLRRHGTA